MSEISLQRVGELLRTVYKILWNKPDGMSARVVLRLIPESMTLTEYELGMHPAGGMPRYERIVRLASIPLTHAGWLARSSTGRWSITAEGRAASKRYAHVEDFYKEAMRLYEEHRRAIPESVMIFDIAQEMAWEQAEKYLLHLKHADLQFMFAELLHAMGYPPMNTPPEDDRADFMARTDPLGVRNKRILVQIRHKGQPVTAEGLRSLQAALSANEYGIIFATSGLTPDAIQELRGMPRITTLGLAEFFDLWKRHYHNLTYSAQARLPLQPIQFLAVAG